MKRLYMITLRAIAAMATLLLVAASAAAQVPQTMSFQGELGTNVSANSEQTLTFKIYASSTGGTALWSEAQTVTLQKRTFSVILGSSTALDIPFDEQYWLGMTVGGGSELSPRVQLTSAPHALNTDKIGGRAVSSDEPEVGDLLAWDGSAWVPSTPDEDESVPSGFMILGSTSTAPTGYTYTGNELAVSDAWATKSSTGFTARAHLASAVVNGKIYLLGGEDGTNVLNTNEEYDPATNSWTTKSSTGFTARTGVKAAVVDGKIYALGGFDALQYGVGNQLNTNEEYDPATDSWSTKSSVGFTARSWPVAAEVDGKIYVIGGLDDGNQSLSTNEEYDPSTDTWSTKSSTGVTASYESAVGVVDGKLYVCGVSSNEEYDPSTDAWTTKSSSPSSRGGAAFAVVNDRMYVLGGFGNSNVNTSEEYDPLTDVWTTKTSSPTARSAHAASVVDGKIYVSGGHDGSYVNTNEEYDPGTVLYVHAKD